MKSAWIYQIRLIAREIANFSPAEQVVYQDSLKHYRDMYSIAETLLEEGREEGRQEGVRQVAKQMKTSGLSVQEIAKYTGLSLNEIEDL